MDKTEIAFLIARARELATIAEKATPGPWIARSLPPELEAVIVGKKEAEICDVPSDAPVWEEIANAMLIAAAPEMAKLLDSFADLLEHYLKEK